MIGYFFSEERDTELMKLWKEIYSHPEEERDELISSLPPETKRDMLILVKRNAEKSHLLTLVAGYNKAVGDFLENFFTKEVNIDFVMDLMRQHQALIKTDKEWPTVATLESLLERFTPSNSSDMIFNIKLDDPCN